MNGNFEYDKGSYPYQAVRFGEGNKIMHLPTQNVIWEWTLPQPTASDVALRINSAYYAAKAGGDKFELPRQRVKDIIFESANEHFSARAITGSDFQTIRDRLKD